MFEAAIFFGLGFFSHYFINRFRGPLGVFKQKAEKKIEETLKEGP